MNYGFWEGPICVFLPAALNWIPVFFAVKLDKIRFFGRVRTGQSQAGSVTCGVQVEAGPVQHGVRQPLLAGDPGGRQTQALRRQQPQLSLAQGHRRNVISTSAYFH